MKRHFFVFLSIFLVVGCASIHDEGQYAENSKAHLFSSYFPTYAGVMRFDTTDEAYSFIRTAQTKLKLTIGKNRAKGLSSKLDGPAVSEDKSVIVAYFLTAGSGNSHIDLSKKEVKLETTLKEAISVSSVFLVFYEDRGVSISDFYLMDGYRYNSNSQYKSFTFNDNEYKTNYPVGWGVEKAFQYLKKEID